VVDTSGEAPVTDPQQSSGGRWPAPYREASQVAWWESDRGYTNRCPTAAGSVSLRLNHIARWRSCFRRKAATGAAQR
jgi:hypothetical protein